MAMENISQEIGDRIPYFQSLSSPKQRRLIMASIRDGDLKQSKVFEKVGWGLWNIKEGAFKLIC